MYKKLDQERYNIYKIIDRLIKNGGCEQTNTMAIAFLEGELKYNETYNGQATYKKTNTNRKMSCYHQKQRDRIYQNKIMISKLKASANL